MKFTDVMIFLKLYNFCSSNDRISYKTMKSMYFFKFEIGTCFIPKHIFLNFSGLVFYTANYFQLYVAQKFITRSCTLYVEHSVKHTVGFSVFLRLMSTIGERDAHGWNAEGSFRHKSF